MEALEPRIRVLQRQCAPKTYPCPHCGKTGQRKTTHTYSVRDIAYREIVILEIQVGEYRARCSCCKTFRSHVPGIEPRAKYTNRVRDAVIDRLLDDCMNMERLREAMRRDFHLDLSSGFMYDCLAWKCQQLDMPDYRQWTLQHFSGTLNIDELHLGRHTLLLATDPLSDFPVAFALVSANDHEHMRRFLHNLKNWGFAPKVVVTDGSNLYPKLLAEVWSDAQHQLCVFHVLKDINDCVLDGLRRLRRRLAAQGKVKRRRGRLSKAQKRAQTRRQATKKKEAYFIWKHRHLLVTHAEKLSGRDRRNLSQMFAAAPALRQLREFVLLVHAVFKPDLTFPEAVSRWADLVTRPEFLADPDLFRAIAMLSEEKFEKMIAYLQSPAGQRVRTNNHVERTNRRLRYFEKVRYKWRRRRTIVRFIVLALDRWRQRHAKANSTEPTHPAIHDTPQQGKPRARRAA
jgi:transposase-like protein